MPRCSRRTRPLGAALPGLMLAVWMGFVALVSDAPASAAAGPPAAPHGPLPDSVLARVAGTRQVSVASFRRAWVEVQDPQHPDSLTPEAARRFLDLLVSKEALAARAMASGAPWPARDSAQFRAFCDQVVMRAALDSVLAETAARRRAAGEAELGPIELGMAARESALIRLEVRYDTTLAERLARAWKALPVPPSDSSMGAQLRMRAQMPDVAPADTARTLARSAAGDYRVAELLQQWAHIDPWVRPRVETADAIEEMVRNGLFERVLRAHAYGRHLERRPDIAARIEARREYIAVSGLVAREVYNGIHPDSAAILEWYRGHPESYRLPARAEVARWFLPDRASAGRLAARLRDDTVAESLIVQGQRGGADFRELITAESDSALFHDAERFGVGTVLGPDSVVAGWRVARVISLAPARVQRFDEARAQIVKDMTDALGEQRMRALVQRVVRETSVRIHPRAVELMLAAH